MFGVTGNALGEDMQEFLSSGLDKVLTKPLNMEKLIQAMKGRPSLVFSSCLSSHRVHSIWLDVENKPHNGASAVAMLESRV
jgi:DNA-binding response OmpR family regulator